MAEPETYDLSPDPRASPGAAQAPPPAPAPLHAIPSQSIPQRARGVRDIGSV